MDKEYLKALGEFMSNACVTCGGSGIRNDKSGPCGACGGSGQIDEPKAEGDQE